MSAWTFGGERRTGTAPKSGDSRSPDLARSRATALILTRWCHAQDHSGAHAHDGPMGDPQRHRSHRDRSVGGGAAGVGGAHPIAVRAEDAVLAPMQAAVDLTVRCSAAPWRMTRDAIPALITARFASPPGPAPDG
jgi:hypothetical protein